MSVENILGLDSEGSGSGPYTNPQTGEIVFDNVNWNITDRPDGATTSASATNQHGTLTWTSNQNDDGTFYTHGFFFDPDGKAKGSFSYSFDGNRFKSSAHGLDGSGFECNIANKEMDEEKFKELLRAASKGRLDEFARKYGYCSDRPDEMDDARNKFHQSKRQISPIILDLDGDGVETTKVNQGAWFDHDGNGFAESTGWVGKDDGLLVRDVDGSGYIDVGSELFGNNTKLSNGQKAANGFEALKDLDAIANGGNADGKIDSNDAAWASLKVWKDANGDGYHSDGEVISLEQAGVRSLNVVYSNSTQTDVNGNAYQQPGSFTKTDGTTGKATVVWFAVDTDFYRKAA